MGYQDEPKEFAATIPPKTILEPKPSMLVSTESENPNEAFAESLFRATNIEAQNSVDSEQTISAAVSLDFLSQIHG